MPDIGATLREARMARRLDITEVEAATKIRAKYLRALENEEWDLLPGPTFVRTFLRTYGDYLDLDSRMLVEDYKQTFQPLSQQDQLPLGATATRAGGRGRGGGGRGIPPVVLVGLVVLALLGALFALGLTGRGGSENADSEPTPTATPAPTETASAPESDAPDDTPAAAAPARKPKRLRFQAVATAEVYVCVVNASNDEVLIDGETLAAGERTRTIQARRLRVTFGNPGVRMRVNGRQVPVADSSPVGYDLAVGRAPRLLSAAERPACA